MAGIKAIIFDCFGVLYVDAKQSLLDTLPPEKAVELADIYQQGNYGLLSRQEYLQAVSSVSGISPEKLQEFITTEHRFNRELGGYIVSELRPKYKIGMLSNIGRDWIDEFFDKHQIHNLFDAVVLSGEEGITKPHPRIYETAAERLGVEPYECVMIDDIQANCAGADAVGMRAIHYQTNEQMMNDLAVILAE